MNCAASLLFVISRPY